MYTYEEHAHCDLCHIIDPDGVVICSVRDEEEAKALLSHLNRG
jgi:hypothetical protein